MIALRHARRRLPVAAAVLLLAIGIGLAVVDPFSGKPTAGAVADNGATTLRTVQRRSLTAQQTVTGTLGYAASWTVAVPSGTSPGDLQQAAQQEASARAGYVTAQISLTSDEQTLATAEAELQAARLKASSDCAGANAATVASVSQPSPCTVSVEAAEANQESLPAAQQKVGADRGQLTAARSALSGAVRALDVARSGSSAYGSAATYTMLPAPGDVVSRGQALYAIDGADALLLYGGTPAWRSFTSGMSPGRDVAELNANLRVLGFRASAGEDFTGTTEQAIEAMQEAHGLAVTGSLPLGSVVFEPDAARVTSVTATVGQSVQPEPLMTLSSSRHDVAIQLDVSEQSQVKVGDRVLVTLPDNRNTPGVVVSVGKVATTPSGGQGGPGSAPASSSPAIPVHVRLLHSSDAGTLDQAPVNVLITTAHLSNVLVIPVTALVALAGGGYALEEVAADGTHRLVGVTPGLFDDQEGLVQVQGAGIAAGQRVVVASS